MRQKLFEKGNSQVVIFLVVMLLIAGGFIGFLVKATPDRGGQSSSSLISQGSVRGTETGTGLETDNQANRPVKTTDFLGEKGETVQAEGEKVFIDEAKVSDGNLQAFNYFSQQGGKTLYFFIVKASDGTYRAAANACEVCFGARTGFKQIGDQIRCENCRTIYTKEQIAMEKGGCNPRPIDNDVPVVNGQLAIELASIEKTADLF